MFSKIKEIAEAWVIAAAPNPQQKKLAEERYSICLECEHYGKSRPIAGDEYCKDCLCSISKKIFTTNTYLTEKKSCPFDKWKPAEDLYWPDTQKKNKSLL